MSIPKNHHYVSQTHQKQFFNSETKKIYVYDKQLDNHYSKISTKHLFSEPHLNTRFNNDNFDNSTLEKELRILFEDDFLIHLNTLLDFIENMQDIDKAYESLCGLTLLGIVGELRHPDYKQHVDQQMNEFQYEILRRIYPVDKRKVYQILEKKFVTPYSNKVSYIEIALKILKKIEPLDFLIYQIKSSDSFILPDTSCFQVRGQIKPRPNKYINEIIQIGIPLTPKVFIIATPQVFKTDLHGIQFIDHENSSEVLRLNRQSYEFAKKAVACNNSIFLRETIDKINLDSQILEF